MPFIPAKGSFFLTMLDSLKVKTPVCSKRPAPLTQTHSRTSCKNRNPQVTKCRFTQLHQRGMSVPLILPDLTHKNLRRANR
jgi:hypothetical protein